MGKLLSLFHCVVRGEEEGDEMAFVQFTECMLPLYAVDDAQGCVCLRWVTAEGENKETGVNMLEAENNRIAVRNGLE